MAIVDTAPPPWCHLGTLLLESLPPFDQVAGHALKLNIASCQIADPFHFETHLIFVQGVLHNTDFFAQLGIEFLLFYHSITH